MILQATPALDLRCTLGEGPVWDAARQVWWWTDIDAACLYRWDGIETAPACHDLPDRLGSLAVAISGRLLLGLAKGLAWCSLLGDSVEVTPLVPVDAAEPRTRVNDGRADRNGNFVFGTFNEAADKRPICSFFQYSSAHGLRRLALPAVSIANSICFSPDGRTMYFTDSLRGLILQCRYDADSAQVDTPRPFAQVAAPAEPDGSVVDADGCLWNAQWGAGLVQRYSPHGQALQQVRVSAPHATCPAFGGPGLATLLVTSARKGLSPAALAAAPLSGALFSCEVPGCAGLADVPIADTPAATVPGHA
jgi:sugar lactone lactonase YvrE